MFGFSKHSNGIDPSIVLFSGNENNFVILNVFQLNYRTYMISIQYAYLNLVHAKFRSYRYSLGYFLTAYYCLNMRKGKRRNYNEKMTLTNFDKNVSQKRSLRRRLDKYVIFGNVPFRLFPPMLLMKRI